MLPEGFSKKLMRLSEEDLFDVLDAVSKEVKRRSGLNNPDVDHEKMIRDHLRVVIEALSGTKI
jgi:hypothetical protein